MKFPRGTSIKSRGLWIGKEHMALEVMVGVVENRPTSNELQRIWNWRREGRATPILLVVSYQGTDLSQLVAICGPTGEEPPILYDIPPSVADRICRTALEERDRHAATRFLRSVLPEAQSVIPGIRNEGFLASHELQSGVPLRTDWTEAQRRSQEVIGKYGRDLVRSLGFQVQEGSGPISFLLAGPRKVAIAAFLDRTEVPEHASERFSGTSPVTYALAKADMEGLPYVVVTAGSMIRVYPTRHKGVGQRGRTETFVEAHLGILPEDKLAYIWYLFSSEALEEGGFLEDILDRSHDYTSDLGRRLRERVYESVIPDLAKAIAVARGLKDPDREELELTYKMSLTLLFRLLFVAYGEDMELLPYRTNGMYRSRSLKHKAQEILDLHREEVPFNESHAHWDETFQLFDAVCDGHMEWGVPPYNGGLFSSDEMVSPVGARLREVRLANPIFGPILRELLIDDSPEGLGPVDFRSLGVREFGTIYEGLLESGLAIAKEDLSLDTNDLYKPASERDTTVVREGEFYLSNTSGARKSMGSFFTKAFAVDHLLEHALEPSLDDHITRLESLSEEDAGEAFFDFRVIDIAMGSGHFLIAAIDRIEKRLLNYLADNPIPAVLDELHRLRAAAKTALGPLGTAAEIEDAQLLRRQIARRCIYGVDLNPMAVDLARVSIWIHTFVPGLPLSLLDAHLVEGNSLVGIGTVKEAEDLLGIDRSTLFSGVAKDMMREITEDMIKVGKLSDATSAEVKKAREEWELAKAKAEPARALMDILTASRIDEGLSSQVPGVLRLWLDDPKKVLSSGVLERSRTTLKAIQPFHFPVVFPEVFWSDRHGFNVILGNPPWEEATIEEDRFWIRYWPGLSGLRQHEQEDIKNRLRRARPDLVTYYQSLVTEIELLRKLLTTGAFPGMGTGDPDLYKAFSWRFWHLLGNDGTFGVVLPRSAFCAKGSGEFRKQILTNSVITDLTFLLNNRNWVFEDVHPQYTIALVSIRKKKPDETSSLPLRGPFRNLPSFINGTKKEPITFDLAEVFEWNDSAALPLLPTDYSAEVFAQLRRSPRLDLDDGESWRARPQTELHATNEKHVMVISKERPEGHWPVFKGESFDIWQPDTGSYYGWIDPVKAKEYLQQKRINSARLARSAYHEFPNTWIEDEATLPCLHPRIAFRDVTRSSDTRTMRAALLPPNVSIQNTGPYLIWPRGNELDQAYLLGVLCSIPLDWYARRFVEIHVNFHIFNPFPIPRPLDDDPLRERVIELAGRLASIDDRFSSWTEAVGVDCGPLSEGEKEDMIHELDAVVAHLYGLSISQLKHIFETFHVGWDFRTRLEATLDHYRAWRDRI